MGSLVGVALPLVLRLVVCAVVLTIGIRSLRRHALLVGPCAVRALDWSGTGWRLELAARRTVDAALMDAGFGCGAWRVLRFRSAEGVHPVYLDGRRLEPREFRRLNRRLRHEAAEAVRARSTG